MRDLGRTNIGLGVCGFTSTFYAMWKLNPAARPALINAPRPFRGLCHYVYRHNNKVYSWGSQFGSVAQADATFTAIWTLTLSSA